MLSKWIRSGNMWQNKSSISVIFHRFSASSKSVVNDVYRWLLLQQLDWSITIKYLIWHNLLIFVIFLNTTEKILIRCYLIIKHKDLVAMNNSKFNQLIIIVNICIITIWWCKYFFLYKAQFWHTLLSKVSMPSFLILSKTHSWGALI